MRVGEPRRRLLREDFHYARILCQINAFSTRFPAISDRNLDAIDVLTNFLKLSMKFAVAMDVELECGLIKFELSLSLATVTLEPSPPTPPDFIF
jgi:hypothetical protein